MKKLRSAIPAKTRCALARRYGIHHGTGEVSCHWCGKLGHVIWCSETWVVFQHEIDHVLERARGGTHELSNLVLACRHCNRSRFSKKGFLSFEARTGLGALARLSALVVGTSPTVGT